MPSSHAQFLTFFAIYLTLFLLLRHRPAQPVRRKSPFPFSLPPFYLHRLAALSILLLAVAVSLSRIYLNYHTSRQVLIGCIAGAVSALVWYAIVGLARTEGVIQWALDNLEILRLLRVRDLVIEEDLAEAGWREWDTRQQRRLAQNKTT